MSESQYSSLIRRIDSIERDVRQTRERVFNGLSDLPGEVKWIRNLLVGMLISAVLGLGGIVIQNMNMVRAIQNNTDRVEAFEKALERTAGDSEDDSAGEGSERNR